MSPLFSGEYTRATGEPSENQITLTHRDNMEQDMQRRDEDIVVTEQISLAPPDTRNTNRHKTTCLSPATIATFSAENLDERYSIYTGG